MSHIHSPALARKAKKYFSPCHITGWHCLHTVAGVHSFAKMTAPEALKARVIMKNNNLKTFPDTSTQRRQCELDKLRFHIFKIVQRLIKVILLSSPTEQQMVVVLRCFLQMQSLQCWARSSVWSGLIKECRYVSIPGLSFKGKFTSWYNNLQRMKGQGVMIKLLA